MKRIVDDEMQLPATSDGKPDWDYMDSYMQDILDTSKETLSHLISVK